MKKNIFSLLSIFLAFASFKSFGEMHHHHGGNDNDRFMIKSGDGNYSLGINGVLQTRATFKRNLIETALRGSDDKRNSFYFYVPEARFGFDGTAFDPMISYYFQAQFAKLGTSEGERPDPADDIDFQYSVAGTSKLSDYYVNMAFHPYAHLRVGKFTAPFSRSQIINPHQQQFFDNKASSEQYKFTDTGKEIGFLVHNGHDEMIEYAFGVVSNGLVLRAGYNFGHVDGYEPVDFDGGNIRFGIAANGFMKTDYISSNFKDFRIGADFIVKYMGFASNGDFYYRRADKENQLGGGIDLSYLILGQYEPVGRYSMVKIGEEIGHQIRAGVNYYMYGHHVKAGLQGGVDMNKSKPQDMIIAAALQFAL